MFTESLRSGSSHCFILLVGCFFSIAIHAQSANDIEVAIGYEQFVSGDYDASYGGLAVIDMRYQWFETGDWQHFVKAGLKQSISAEGANLTAFDIGFGSVKPLTTFFDRELSFDYSLGAIYVSEEISVQLIDRLVENNLSETTFMVTTGLNYQIYQEFDSRLYISQIGSNGTSVGLQFSYSF